MLERSELLGNVNVNGQKYSLSVTSLEVHIFRLISEHTTVDDFPDYKQTYKELTFTGQFIHGNWILQIHWKDILVVEFNFTKYQITELHYGQTWVLQLYELYDEKVGIEDRRRLQELYESQKRYEEEQEKKFAPLKEE